MTRTIQVLFDGTSLRPIDPLDLPRGSVLQVTLDMPSGVDHAALPNVASLAAYLRTSSPVPGDLMDEFDVALRTNEQKKTLSDPFEIAEGE